MGLGDLKSLPSFEMLCGPSHLSFCHSFWRKMTGLRVLLFGTLSHEKLGKGQVWTPIDE